MSTDNVNDLIVTMRLAIKELQHQIDKHEVELDRIREELTYHEHPFQWEPVYGAPR